MKISPLSSKKHLSLSVLRFYCVCPFRVLNKFAECVGCTLFFLSKKKKKNLQKLHNTTRRTKEQRTKILNNERDDDSIRIR